MVICKRHKLIKPSSRLRRLSVAVAQINTHLGNLRFNSDKILLNLNHAKKNNADLLILPELSICGYPPEDLLLKNYFIKCCYEELLKVATKVKDLPVLVGFPEDGKDGCLYNSVAVLLKGKISQIYRKNLLPNYGVFDERRYFSPGKNPLLIKIRGFIIAVTICEDIWDLDGEVVKHFSKEQPHLIINLSASPYSVTKELKRDQILKSVARTVNAHLLYCNLTGAQDELVFDGRSRLMSPQGNTLCKMKSFKEDFNIFKFTKRNDESKIVYIQEGEVPSNALNDNILLKDVLNALELGMRDYIQKNGFKKVLIGLSGGIDSALVAALAVRALGKNSVIGVTMPSIYSSKETYQDAIKSSKVCQIQLLTIPIKEIHQVILHSMEPFFLKTPVGIAEENMQARIRGMILMSLSNKFNWLVLATGNKSELATGYCTLYGDMCGGFAPIKDVSKTLVYKLSAYINKIEKKQLIPISVIRRPPTAELRPNQKDQDSLPPYSMLDKILEHYIEKDLASDSLNTNMKPREVKRIIDMVNRNEYKRRQAPIGTKITDKAFGKDRRLPVTNGFAL